MKERQKDKNEKETERFPPRPKRRTHQSKIDRFLLTKNTAVKDSGAQKKLRCWRDTCIFALSLHPSGSPSFQYLSISPNKNGRGSKKRHL